MDWMKLPEKLWSLVKQYRYAALVLVLGLVLMALPKPEKRQEAPALPAQEQTLSDELEKVLSAMAGVGETRVLLTQVTGPETRYETNGDGNPVLVSRGSGIQEGLVQRVEEPKYRGAIVVCRGGNDPKVRLRVVEAVSRVTGLGADQISVMKMN